MNPVWSALVWKEWREHRWKMLALTTIALGVTVGCWDFESGDGLMLGLVISTAFLLPIGALFVALGAAAGEQSRGTLPFLRALPHNMQRIAALKLAFALATIVIATIASVGVTRTGVWMGNKYDWLGMSRTNNVLSDMPMVVETGNWAADWLILLFLVTLSLVLWFSAIGVNRADEVRAGAIGLVVSLGLWVVFLTAVQTLGIHFQDTLAQPEWEALAAAMPGGVFLVRPFTDGTNRWAWIAFGYLATHGPLAVWYLRRFGREGIATRWSPKPATARAVWLQAPRSSPTTALIWKTLREAAPVVAVAFVAAVGVAVAITVSEMIRLREYVLPHSHSLGAFRYFAEIGHGMLTAFGFLAGCVAGVFAIADLRPRVATFWQSRPISIDHWYLMKYLGGVLLLTFAFAVPAWLFHEYLISTEANWWNYPGGPRRQHLTGVITALAPLLAYSATWLAAVTLRHTIYALLVGVGAALSVVMHNANVWEERLGVQLAITLAAIAASTIAAWLAVRYDWAFRK